VKVSTKQIEAALLASHGLVAMAAASLGVSRSAIYARVERNQRLKEVVEQERESFVDLAEERLRMAVERGEAWAVALVIKTLGKKRGYTERQEIETTDVNVVIKKLSGVSFDDI
jgi:hypothetical protein